MTDTIVVESAQVIEVQNLNQVIDFNPSTQEIVVTNGGPQGVPGPTGTVDGVVISVVEGTGITVDDTDPVNPVVGVTPNTYDDYGAATTAANAAEDAAASYSDTHDSSTLTSAESYTDTKAAAALVTAAATADTKDAATLVLAKSYADTQDAIALTVAQAYSDGQDATTLVTAEAYTDVEAVARASADALRILASEKGAASGVATLDSGGKIPSSQLPSIALVDSFPVADQAARLALSVQVGDIAIQADNSTSYILHAAPASTNSNWLPLAAPGLVQSVNGRTGVVTGLSEASDLTTEIANRTSADALKADASALTTEIANRTSADALKADASALTTEISNRTSADALKADASALATEVTNRTNADTTNLATAESYADGKISAIIASAIGSTPTSAEKFLGLQSGAIVAFTYAQMQGLQFAAVARTVAALPANTYSNGASGVGATITGTANGALSAQDGVTLTVSQVLVVANEASQSNNGLYSLTQVGDGSHPFILTRVGGADTAATLIAGLKVYIIKGTQWSGSNFALTSNVTTVGTTAVTFVNQSSKSVLAVTNISGNYTYLGSDELMYFSTGGLHNLPLSNAGMVGKSVTIFNTSTTNFALISAQSPDVYTGPGILGYLSSVTIRCLASGVWQSDRQIVNPGQAGSDPAAHSELGTANGAYGDGSDGPVTFNGSSTILGMVPSSNVYTMTRDIYCTSITINTGVTLKTQGFRIYANIGLTNNGTIQNIGGNGAAVATAGTLTPRGTIGQGSAAGAGTITAGSGATNAQADTMGGAGGAGGLGSSGAGGNGGTATALSSTDQNAHHGALAFTGVYYATAATNAVAVKLMMGGAGGGGGGGDGTAGGGGGTGGGPILICAFHFDNTNGTITVAGGNGGSPAGGNRGGGGGGGGGWILVATHLNVASGTMTVSGGTGGTKQGTGVNGSNGSSGTAQVIVF